MDGRKNDLEVGDFLSVLSQYDRKPRSATFISNANLRNVTTEMAMAFLKSLLYIFI